MTGWRTVLALLTRRDITAFATHWPRNLDEDTLAREVDALIARMSLREKIAQMSGDGGNLTLVKLGIYILLLKRFPNIYSGYHRKHAIPPLSFTDGPRGIVIGRASCFPVAMLRGASFDPALEQRIGAAIGAEARASGANYFAGLCVNLLRHPAWGRAQETYSEDSLHLGQMGIGLMHGVQSQHVMVCAKHFAVNSIENSRFYVDVHVDERTLHEVYLPHFKALVDAGVDSLMSAYNRINGEYCGHSQTLLHEILREQWGFTGFVSSDWLWGIYETTKPVVAGMDIEMPRASHYGWRLWWAVKRGRVPESLIDRTVRRILTAKLRWLSRSPMEQPSTQLIACEAHRALAQESAEQSIVLLKNHAMLPLSDYPASSRTIAVIGDLACAPGLGDNGSSRVSPPAVVTILDGLRARAGSNITIHYHDGEDIKAASDCAGQCDVVILVAGYRADDEGENLTSNRQYVSNPTVPRGGDRRSLQLAEHQQQLIKTVCAANAATAVVLIGGSAIMMDTWQEEAAAILWAGYPGMQGGHAVARILFGDVNPSGKLPFTIPTSAAQLPAFDCWAETAHYDYLHGYTLQDALQQQPAFHFGFGLSYTQFAYSSLHTEKTHYDSTDTITISVSIANMGERDGADVVQCYIGHTEPAALPAARKRLCAFRKVRLVAHQQQCVTLHIPVSQLARYHADNKRWQVEAGEYRVWAGNSANEDDLLSLTVQIGN